MIQLREYSRTSIKLVLLKMYSGDRLRGPYIRWPDPTFHVRQPLDNSPHPTSIKPPRFPIPLFPLAPKINSSNEIIPHRPHAAAQPPSMSESEQRLLRRDPPTLYKQNSWSPDILRDEAWTNRRRSHRTRRGRSVTDDDFDELRACFELGFNFDSPDLDPKLSSTFPALELYYAVNRRYSSSTNLSRSSSASFSDCDSASSSLESPRSFIDPGKVLNLPFSFILFFLKSFPIPLNDFDLKLLRTVCDVDQLSI